MNPDTHVYCTQCKHFRISDESLPCCPYEDMCEINDCEDSMPFRDKPCYEQLKTNE